MLLLLASCQERELDLIPGHELTITADLVDGTADTRTSSELVEGGKTRVYWSPGDQIKVFSAGESSVFTSQNTTPSRTAKFKGTVSMIFGDDGEGETDYIWGLYPNREDATYSEPAGSSATALITTTLPSVQQGKEDSFADGTFITIGRSAESLRIPFKGVCTGVYITFENDTDIDRVTLAGLDHEVLAGRFTAGLEEGADGSLTPYIKTVSVPEYEVTVVAPDGGTFKKDKMYYIITLPVKFTRGFSLTAHKTTGETGSCSITPASAPEFKVNAIGSVKKLDNRIDNWVLTDPALNEIWYTVEDESIPVDFSLIQEGVSGAYREDIGCYVASFDDPVTDIPDRAFYQNTNLKTMVLPASVQSIGNTSFCGCKCLISVKLTDPNTLTTILPCAFDSALRLKVVGGNVEPVGGKYYTDLPAVTSLGYSAFYQTDITHVRLPVLETLASSFYLSDLLTIEIPNVRIMKSDAIYTSYVTKINLPAVEVMNENCLGECRLAEEIHIGPNVGSMANKLFNLHSSSTVVHSLSFYMEATVPPVVSENTFVIKQYGTQLIKVSAVYVPAASEAAYEAAWADALAIALPEGKTAADVIQPMPES